MYPQLFLAAAAVVSGAPLDSQCVAVQERAEPGVKQPQLGYGVDFPDPSLISYNGKWYAYGTTVSDRKVPVATSEDGQQWTYTDVDAMKDQEIPWVVKDDSGDWSQWAPDVQLSDDGSKFIMYFNGLSTVGDKTIQSIGMAISEEGPLGPFKPFDNYTISDYTGGGVIDASGFDDGTDRWMVYKTDGNGRGGASTCGPGPTAEFGSDEYAPTPIMLQKMDRDGVTLVGEPVQILDNLGEQNDGVVEAPVLYKSPDGPYALFYSTHCWSSDYYDIEVAYSDSIEGPYTDRQIVQGSAVPQQLFGPGGLDIDPNGETVVFHARSNEDAGGAAPRLLYAMSVQLDGMKVVTH